MHSGRPTPREPAGDVYGNMMTQLDDPMNAYRQATHALTESLNGQHLGALRPSMPAHMGPPAPHSASPYFQPSQPLPPSSPYSPPPFAPAMNDPRMRMHTPGQPPPHFRPSYAPLYAQTAVFESSAIPMPNGHGSYHGVPHVPFQSAPAPPLFDLASQPPFPPPFGFMHPPTASAPAGEGMPIAAEALETRRPERRPETKLPPLRARDQVPILPKEEDLTPVSAPPSVNIAWVIIHGVMKQPDWNCLHESLDRMGFDDRRILHKEEEVIEQDEVKAHLISIVESIRPGSKFLIIMVTKEFNKIKVESSFLMDEIYKMMILFNNKQDKEAKSALNRVAMRRHYANRTFDSRFLAGASLHVVLDGVSGSPLPHVLSMRDSAKTPSQNLEAEWRSLPRHPDEKLQTKMKAGRIVQLWSDWRSFGHQPCALFNAFMQLNLEEPELPYDAFLNRLDRCVRIPISALRAKQQPRPVAPGPDGEGGAIGRAGEEGMTSRTGGEFAVGALQYLVGEYLKQQQLYSEERAKKKWETAIATGNALCSSMNKFDPHRSLDFSWRD